MANLNKLHANSTSVSYVFNHPSSKTTTHENIHEELKISFKLSQFHFHLILDPYSILLKEFNDFFHGDMQPDVKESKCFLRMFLYEKSFIIH